jgi:hypothetical protein
MSDQRRQARGDLRRQLLVSAASIVLVVATLGSFASASTTVRTVSAGVVTADVRASLGVATLPSDLSPSVSSASTDTALVDTPALSNCNVVAQVIVLSKCVFGDRTGKHTMFLWGDSHAFMWFPALNAVAKSAHWRLVALMAYGCPVADVSVWDTLTNTGYGSCNAFRSWVIGVINRMKPSLVVVAEAFTGYAASGHGAPDTISPSQWETGLEKSLKLVHAKNVKKVVLGSTVSGTTNPPQCLASNPTAVQSCTVMDTPDQQAQRSAEQAAAKAEKALYVNTLPWLCSTTATTQLACSPVIGDSTDGYFIVYYSTGHLTETYDLFLQGVLGGALRRDMP